jgi:zinc protease
VAPKSYVGLVFCGPLSWSREQEHHLESLVEYMDIKLREKIREEAGETYNVSINYSVSRYPDEEYHISIVFGCDPQKASLLSDKVFEEIETIRTSPPAQTYMEKIKEIQKRDYETALEENGFWLNNLYRSYLYDMELDTILQYDSLIAQLQAEDIRRVAHELLKQDRYIKVVLYPEGFNEE